MRQSDLIALRTRQKLCCDTGSALQGPTGAPGVTGPTGLAGGTGPFMAVNGA